MTQLSEPAIVTGLLPCPFWGSEHPQWVGSADGDYVECGSCLATMPPHDAEVPNETARWNTRLSPASPNAGEIERLREDTDFLLARSGHAGKCMFGGKRWTGMSSNSLVSIAFGDADERLPSDSSDLAACYRTVMRLPKHRRTDAGFDHLEAGERHVESKYEGSIKWAREDTGWPGRATLSAGSAGQ